MTAAAITLDVRGEPCPALLHQPEGPGPHPGVVLGQEATGPNRFIGEVAASLADAGYVVLIPDYYDGAGPPDPEAYDDIETLIAYMDRLDFRRAAYGAVAALDYLAGRPDVDPSRLALWGYCTGASVALLAAGLRPGVAATVLFYPSQPRFEVNDRTRPIDPIDLIWNVDSSVLLLLGEDDFVWPPELVAEVRTRFDRWDVDHVIRTYAGAGHAFCAPSPMFHHAEASAAAWADALDHLATRLGARGTTA